jgi:hypothetical protein
MPIGRPRKYAGPLRKGEKTASVPQKGGLNKTEAKQVRAIAKHQVKLRSETKQRPWLYPKTAYSELQHNKPFFLFGDKSTNGLLNLAKGDDSIYHPNGGQLPIDAPGNCREGQQVRLQALTHNCILSGDGANKNTMVRLIMFSYPTDQDGIVEADILLQPTGTGEGQGWPNIFLSKNTVNSKGIRFLLDRTYQVNGQSSGASNDGTIDVVNWGYSGVRTFQFNKYFRNGRRIKYVENPNGDDSPIPAVNNYGMMIIPYGSGVSEQDENCGRIEILGNMLFKDL